VKAANTQLAFVRIAIYVDLCAFRWWIISVGRI